HLLDLGLSIGLLLGFIAALVFVARKFPLYCYWEINLKPETAAAVDDVADTGAIHS
ncbi:MAG: hypothetical protein IIC10_10715, partial [Proteobacteria bacterium]|nr:hypothetical protein [Pseudomonadota bacterium]